MSTTPVSVALKIALETLEMPNWDQDKMIEALIEIARLLAAAEALENL